MCIRYTAPFPPKLTLANEGDTASETVDVGNTVVVNDATVDGDDATVGGNDATIEDSDTAAGDNDAGMGGPTRLLVTRTTEQITLVESRTQEFNGNAWVLNFYRNEAYTCGLSGYYTFMVIGMCQRSLVRGVQYQVSVKGVRGVLKGVRGVSELGSVGAPSPPESDV
jgi:hypothetical protein